MRAVRTGADAGSAALLRRVERRSLMLAGVLLVLSLVLRSLPVTAGVGAGALLGILNFRWLGRFAAAMLGSGRTKPSKLLLFLYSFKYLLLGVVIFLLIKYDLSNAFALLAGISVIFLAICWEGVTGTINSEET